MTYEFIFVSFIVVFFRSIDTKDQIESNEMTKCPNNGHPKLGFNNYPLQCLPGNQGPSICGSEHVCWFNGFNYLCCPMKGKENRRQQNTQQSRISENDENPERNIEHFGRNRQRSTGNENRHFSEQFRAPSVEAIGKSRRNPVDFPEIPPHPSIKWSKCPPNSELMLFEDGQIHYCLQKIASCPENGFCHFNGQEDLCCRKPQQFASNRIDSEIHFIYDYLDYENDKNIQEPRNLEHSSTIAPSRELFPLSFKQLNTASAVLQKNKSVSVFRQNNDQNEPKNSTYIDPFSRTERITGISRTRLEHFFGKNGQTLERREENGQKFVNRQEGQQNLSGKDKNGHNFGRQGNSRQNSAIQTIGRQNSGGHKNVNGHSENTHQNRPLISSSKTQSFPSRRKLAEDFLMKHVRNGWPYHESYHRPSRISPAHSLNTEQKTTTSEPTGPISFTFIPIK